MTFARDWFETFKRVLLEPSQYFEEEDRNDGFGYPLKFAITSIIITGVISATQISALGMASMGMSEAPGVTGASTFFLAGIILVAAPILGLLGLLITSAIYHLFVYLLGGKEGYRKTLAALEYGTAVSPINSLFSFIPLLGSLISLILGIYTLYIEIKAIENFQNMSTGRAALALLLPLAIFVVVMIGLFILFIAILAGSGDALA
jgi:hypothetical protein